MVLSNLQWVPLLLAKPSKASIEYRNSLVESGNEIVGVEGNQLRLACIVSGGKPPPNVTWTRIDKDGNKEIIDVKDSLVVDKVTTVTLIKELTRSDLNSRYECHVEHEAVTDNSLDSFIVMDLSGKYFCQILKCDN